MFLRGACFFIVTFFLFELILTYKDQVQGVVRKALLIMFVEQQIRMFMQLSLVFLDDGLGKDVVATLAQSLDNILYLGIFNYILFRMKSVEIYI